MKIKDILVAGGIALGAMTSCSNFLELEPKDASQAETFFKTSREAQQALVGIYEKLRSDYDQTRPNDIRMFDMAMGDDAMVGGDPSGQDMLFYQEMSKFKAQTNNLAGEATWDKCYAGIQRANTLLDNFDQIDFSSVEEEEGGLKDNIMGEALFLRAHFYFELVRLFENIPLYTQPLLSNNDWQGIKQGTPDETYAQIAKDMAEATVLMSASTAEGQEGRLNKHAAKAELVKVYLFYTGYYGKSELPIKDGFDINKGKEGMSEQIVTAFNKDHMIAMADDVINESGAVLSENYADLFNQNGNYNKEVIFEIPFANTGSGDWGDWSYGSILCQMSGPRSHTSDNLVDGWGFMIPTHELEQSFEEGDLRKSATILYSKDLIDAGGGTYGVNFNFTGMHSNKYTTHAWNKAEIGSVELNWGQNYHYIRLADVYLMAAELNLDTDNAKAAEYYNKIRARAFGDNLHSKATVTLEDIQNERRLELAMEGHRYFDVLRRGVQEAAVELNVSGYTLKPPTETDDFYIDDDGNNMTGDVGDPETFNVTFDVEKKGFLPIPQVEVDLHSALNQNKGY